LRNFGEVFHLADAVTIIHVLKYILSVAARFEPHRFAAKREQEPVRQEHIRRGDMSETVKPGRTMTRRDRCTRIITTVSRAGRDREIHKAMEMVLACRGLSALTDIALEDLATRVAADEYARRFVARRDREGRVISLDRYRSQHKN
jgi:hypothetical protein